MIMANFFPVTYEFYFSSDRCINIKANDPTDGSYSSYSANNRRLSGDDAADDGTHESCHQERWRILDCAIFGHPWTLHFFANDIIMCFHFALAMKEITEASLPGGSFNPPFKAFNPLITTLGGVLGSILVYFVLLEVFISWGMFDKELTSSMEYSDFARGWGIVTATDIVLAWLGGRLVFGDGHPAIDFLLLLAVADDAIGMAIIAIFYPDPDHPVEPIYLLLVAGAMGIAYAFRKWHFRKTRVEHQGWQPYILITGVISWCGLINSRIHPALALVFVVPFMPGPNREGLELLDEQFEDQIEIEVTHGDAPQMITRSVRSNTYSYSSGVTESSRDSILTDHHANHGRNTTIQAGLFAGLAGHRVDDAFKVEEYDEDGHMSLHVSTLDSFEHFWKPFVDFGLGLFALVNAGVKLDGVGSMTSLILISLVVGKYFGITIMFKVGALNYINY
jgi:Na+/H+ antiporter NhaA